MDGSSKDYWKIEDQYQDAWLSMYHVSYSVMLSLEFVRSMYVNHPDAEIPWMSLTMEHPQSWKPWHAAPVVSARAGAIDEGFHCRQHECPLSSPVSQVTITKCQKVNIQSPQHLRPLHLATYDFQPSILWTMWTQSTWSEFLAPRFKIKPHKYQPNDALLKDCSPKSSLSRNVSFNRVNYSRSEEV